MQSVFKCSTLHELGQDSGLDLLCTSRLFVESGHGTVPGFELGLAPSWVLTSWAGCLVGEAWDPGTGEKGLSGLVRLTELMGLAGLLVLKEPDAPLATEQEKQREVKVAGIDSLEHRHI